jgi:hypothetical protein
MGVPVRRLEMKRLRVGNRHGITLLCPADCEDEREWSRKAACNAGKQALRVGCDRFPRRGLDFEDTFECKIPDKERCLTRTVITNPLGSVTLTSMF